MGSITESQTVANLCPPLAPTEYIGPKGWIRYFYTFDLGDDYDMDHVSELLQRSFKALKNRVPIVGCEVFPAPGKQEGLLQFRHYGDEIDDFRVKDLRAQGAFPHTYAELKAKRFPASAFDHKTLCFRTEWPSVGDRIPTTQVQANFIQGGLILNWCMFHAFADGTTCYKWTELWAEEMRRAQGIKITAPAEVPVEDRAKFMNPPNTKPGRVEDHPEYLAIPFTPTGPPEKLLSPIHHGHVFYISPSNLAALKAEASPQNANLYPNLAPFVSTNDAICALVWRTVMRAQHPDAVNASPESDTRTSLCAISLDGRRRLSPPAHEYTIGNFFAPAPCTLPLPTLTTSASLADIAATIRAGVAAYDAQRWASLTSIVNTIPDVNRLVPTVFLDLPGLNVLQTTWRHFPLYDVEWGTALGGKMDSVRVPHVGVTHCLEIVLPGCKDGGVELFVGCENAAMEKLLKDELWNKFVEPIMF
ncbi:hypothetical protein K490DRAFT_36988 [Saccharata proteae CBS 121410]|uniref:Transferase family protein n=1 Tax=Saccharata proteae CBS 121410 TaxID=1314787 RepID=A0A6A5YE28_9PEZI|nr:hypothetical protein K490DRAFT_36988 [Saccharata proteae CBS 121410]